MANGAQTLKLIALLACGGMALAGCEKKAASAPPPPIPEVAVVMVQPQAMPATFEYVGQTLGSREVEVRARVSGILEHWNYREGAKVTAGESLFTIDPAPFRAALAKAEAALASAEATLSMTSRNAARIKPLYESQLVTQKEYEDILSGEQIATANVKAAQAAVTEARLNLSYSRVEAPISGVTSRALKSEGSLVEAQQTLLTTISQNDPIHVIFSFTEAEHLKFTRAMSEGRLTLPKDGKFDVTLKLADGSDYPQAGKVDFTDVRVDSTTGTIQARAVVPNPQQILRSGQFVRVRLSGATRPGAIVIPQRAVLEGSGSKIVLTVNGQGTVEPRPVQVGDWSGEDWLITGGLNPGDKVIVDGMVKARPGAQVKVAQAAGTPSAAPVPAADAPPAKPAPEENKKPEAAAPAKGNQ